ncbi:hypothetical protein FOZ62_029704, partial [Perkinsus olseni]
MVVMNYLALVPSRTRRNFTRGLVEAILDSDGVAVATEDEILLLIERWNAQGDKSKEEMARLMRCYRQEPFKSDYNKKMSGPPAHRGKLLRAATNIEDIGHRKLPRSHRFKEDDMVSLVGERVPSEKEANLALPRKLRKNL